MQTNNSWMRAVRWLLPAVALLLLTPGVARADFTLWDWSVNYDGTTYDLFTPYKPPPGATLPPFVNDSGFNYLTGRGTLIMTFGGAGLHLGGVYFYNFYDHSDGIDHSSDYASANASLPVGVSYQLDWPGMLSPTAPPTVFDNFSANTLPNTNGVGTVSPPPTACCSVAMAMLSNFSLAAGQTGILMYQVTSTAPAPGIFYLQETDSETGASLYLTGHLTITGGDVPEPASVWLLLTVCGGALYGIRKRTTKTK